MFSFRLPINEINTNFTCSLFSGGESIPDGEGNAESRFVFLFDSANVYTC